MKNLLFLPRGSPHESQSLTRRKRLLMIDSNPHTCALVRILRMRNEKFRFFGKKHPKNVTFWPFLVIFEDFGENVTSKTDRRELMGP